MGLVEAGAESGPVGYSLCSVPPCRTPHSGHCHTAHKLCREGCGAGLAGGRECDTGWLQKGLAVRGSNVDIAEDDVVSWLEELGFESLADGD